MFGVALAECLAVGFVAIVCLSPKDWSQLGHFISQLLRQKKEVERDIALLMLDSDPGDITLIDEDVRSGTGKGDWTGELGDADSGRARDLQPTNNDNSL